MLLIECHEILARAENKVRSLERPTALSPGPPGRLPESLEISYISKLFVPNIRIAL